MFCDSQCLAIDEILAYYATSHNRQPSFTHRPSAPGDERRGEERGGYDERGELRGRSSAQQQSRAGVAAALEMAPRRNRGVGRGIDDDARVDARGRDGEIIDHHRSITTTAVSKAKSAEIEKFERKKTGALEPAFGI